MKVKELKVIYDERFIPKVIEMFEKDIPKEVYNGGYKSEEVYSLLEYMYNVPYLIEENAYIVAFYDDKLIGTFHLSQGTDADCDMDTKAIYRFLLLVGANRYTIVHNHPNCKDNMSQNDFEITNKLMELDSNFDMQMINHIVIGKDNWRCIDFEVLEMNMNDIDDVNDYYNKE